MAKTKLRILVLEDRPDFIDKMKEALEIPEWSEVLEVIYTMTVEEAWVEIQKGPWFLAFFDHDLPDGNSGTILNRYQFELGEFPCPIWGISAAPSNNQRIINMGGAGSIAKMEGDAFIPKIRDVVLVALRGE